MCFGSALLSSACASTVAPIQLPLSKTKPNVEFCAPPSNPPTKTVTKLYAGVDPRERLEWMVCALHEKAAANLNQAQRWENRTEWRDIPLIAAAATVAGLLLFGNRGADNKLSKGTQNAISIAGFGAASFATIANYLSPQRARELLRQGARGHYCLATQGELILAV